MSRELARATIVVIDNNELVLAATREALENAGHRVLTHSRPSGAVALILQEKPNLVLLEVNFGADSVAKLFGKAQPNSTTVVLLYSSLSADALEAKAAACGAHGFIRKTPDGVDFLRQVNGWLRKSSASGADFRAVRIGSSEDDRSSRPSGPRVSTSEPYRETEAKAEVQSEVPIQERVVLFIDDEMEMLSLLRREVQGEPYSAEFALSGAQALKRILSSSPPDLVVADVRMPEPNGPAVYQSAVGANSSWRSRFLFLTGALPDRSELEGFEGAVLLKPLRGAELRKTIRQRLSLLDEPSASGRR